MITINSILDTLNYIDDVNAVIFDLDDTLYNEIDYMVSGFNVIIKFLNDKCNIKIDNNIYVNKMIDYYKSGEKPIDKLLYDFNIYNADNKDICVDIYRKHSPTIKLSVDIVFMLEKIKKMKKRLGIITDGRPEGQRAKIKALNLEKYIEYIIITDEIGGVEYRKPNKVSYDMMKEHFCVEYEEMCYVGDNICKDFVYPCICGIKPIYYINSKSLKNIKL